MTVLQDSTKPWLAHYDNNSSGDIAPAYTDALGMFRAAVASAPQNIAVHYFDACISYAELDVLSDALALFLSENKFKKGDRLAIYMQSMPQFIIAALAAWKLHGIVVPVNPMNRERELDLLLRDAEPAALICQEDLYRQVIVPLCETETPVPLLVLTTNGLAFQARNDPRIFAALKPMRCEGAQDLLVAIAAKRGQKPSPPQPLQSSDTAILCYTSGTTGQPKGAMITHGAISFNAQSFSEWCELNRGDTVLGIAPLFHITGLVLHMGLSFYNASPLILLYRFEPGVMLDALREFRPVFTVGAITAFIALMHHPDATPGHFGSLTKIYSGGAPVPAAVVDEFENKFGRYIHNCYGLTETAAQTHMVPLHQRARVNPDDGVVSVGLPNYNSSVCIVDDAGNMLPPRQIGEIVSRGPMVAPGYWNKPEETEKAMRADGFHTGDVGFMDEDGWFYLVDRKKDLIICSGYKVWPREVEDVLYTHPAVREAGVIGIPDSYRGESVKAFVSLKPGAQVNPDELIDHCKARMAAYKYPRSLDIIDELPKTPTGKILRRSLRELSPQQPPQRL